MGKKEFEVGKKYLGVLLRSNKMSVLTHQSECGVKSMELTTDQRQSIMFPNNSWVKFDVKKEEEKWVVDHLDLIDIAMEEDFQLVEHYIKRGLRFSRGNQVVFNPQSIVDARDEANIQIQHEQEQNERRIQMAKDWLGFKKTLSYCVLDLESDGDHISQFAYTTGDEVYTFDGKEKNITILKQVLEKCEVIVGHNIQNWDLPILESIYHFEMSPNQTIWDTLSVEFLQHPHRQFYSLDTTHQAKDDVALTENLFLQQVKFEIEHSYRTNNLLSAFPFLTKLNNDSKRSDILKAFPLESRQCFNQEMQLSGATCKMLKSIKNISDKKKILIIAPKSIWAQISRHLSVRFLFPDKPEFNETLCSENIKKIPPESVNSFQRYFLEEFCKIENKSFTPLLMNFPAYLRHSDNRKNNPILFPEEILQKATGQNMQCFKTNIDCVDSSGLFNKDFKKNEYKKIYVIQEPILNLTSRSDILADSTFQELEMKGDFLYRMGNRDYMEITKDEFGTLSTVTESVHENPETFHYWCEREGNNTFSFYHSLKFSDSLTSLLNSVSLKKTALVWSYEKQKSPGKLCALKYFGSDSLLRGGSGSRNRSRYWLLQLALLDEYMQENKLDLPVIYITDDASNTELSIIANEFGFKISDRGTYFKRMNYVHKYTKGILFLTKEEFFNQVVYYDLKFPYLYVWDNLDLEKYKVIWGNENLDYCLDNLSKMVEYYSNLVCANHEDTRMLLLDPCMDWIEHSVGCFDICRIRLDEGKLNAKLAELKVNRISPLETQIDLTGETKTKSMTWISQCFLNGNEFYGIQKKVLPHILRKEHDCVVSIPTGGGKSVLFQGPALLRSMYSRRLSLVVIPLKALMQDQVEELHRKGFSTSVDYLNGDRTNEEKRYIYSRLLSGELSLLYITPERFRVNTFIEILKQRMEQDGGLDYVVFDEAHCISQWGLDFRPDYLYAVKTCVELRNELKDRWNKQTPSDVFMVTLFSATVSAMVLKDFKRFFPDLEVYGQLPSTQESKLFNPVRDHIRIRFKEIEQKDETRLAEIVSYLKEKEIDFNKSRMMVFCATRRQCEELSVALNNLCENNTEEFLSKCYGHIGYFHAGMDSEKRNAIYTQFLGEKLYILFATKAFGMGMDIPNIHYVIHFTPPEFMEDYLQEVGRAGRNIQSYHEALGNKQIDALCMYSREDFYDMKKLMLYNLLDWSYLESARTKIFSYISQFPDLNGNPIPVPYSVWLKDPGKPDNISPSRMAFYWLEQLGCIQTSTYDTVSPQLTLLPGGNQDLKNKEKLLWDYLNRTEFKNPENGKVQVPFPGMMVALKMTFTELMDSLLALEEKNLLELHQNFNCCMTDRRKAEIVYMTGRDSEKKFFHNTFALHVVFEALRELLSKSEPNQIFHYTEDECRQAVRDQFNLQFEKIKEDIVKVNEVEYMPWYNPNEQYETKTVMRLDTFTRNLCENVGAGICKLANCIDNINMHSDVRDGKVFYWLKTSRKNKCKEALTELEMDCLCFLEYLVQKSGPITWPLWWKECKEFTRKGYCYLEKILSVLKYLQYIDCDSLLDFGVKVRKGAHADEDMGQFDKTRFVEEMNIKKYRLIAMKVFTQMDPVKQNEFINAYFGCQSSQELMNLLNHWGDEQIKKEITEQAIEQEEERMRGNAEQQKVYQHTLQHHLIVEAGPGSGKTYMLTMKCAQLVYRLGIAPQKIMVLAFNRGVVEELRTRLNKLFWNLGLGNAAKKLHVYTFDALALHCMPELEKQEIKDWYKKFLDLLEQTPQKFQRLFSEVQYVLVDEFQDVNEERLEYLNIFYHIFNNLKYMVIGDQDQSIYGFSRVDMEKNEEMDPIEYAKSISSSTYYNKFKDILTKEDVDELTLSINYRSYPKILEMANKYRIRDTKKPMPCACKENMGHQEACAFIYTEGNWLDRVDEILKKKDMQIQDLAIMFRSNQEVYDAFKQIHSKYPDLNVRIQGAESIPFYRKREVYFILKYLEDNSTEVFTEDSLIDMEKKILYQIESKTKWDKPTMDMLYTLILCWWDTVSIESYPHLYGELAEYIRTMDRSKDNGAIYKIYYKYQNRSLFSKDCFSVILTTVYKVKGLEFDAVIMAPSQVPLPQKQHRVYEKGDKLMIDDIADLQEEIRVNYVACTRARKHLDIVMGPREQHLQKYLDLYALKTSILADEVIWKPTEENIPYRERICWLNDLDKYNLGFPVFEPKFYKKHMKYMESNVALMDPIEIKKGKIYHGSQVCIGMFSQNVTEEDLKNLEGKKFFIRDLAVFEYNDSVNHDQRSGSTYADKWCEDSKGKYTYIPILAECTECKE